MTVLRNMVPNLAEARIGYMVAAVAYKRLRATMERDDGESGG